MSAGLETTGFKQGQPGYRREPRRALVCTKLLGTRGRSFLTRELKALKITCASQSDMNSFPDLARAADRVQSSGWNRQTRLMILNRFL
eukprot:8424448-Pyramimonas_sp.AAC.1